MSATDTAQRQYPTTIVFSSLHTLLGLPMRSLIEIRDLFDDVDENADEPKVDEP